MEFIKALWNWVVYSSADSKKFSLTLKGIAAFVITLLSFRYGIQNVQILNENVSVLVDAVVAFVQDAVTLVSIIATIYGAVRKVVLTAKGEAATLK